MIKTTTGKHWWLLACTWFIMAGCGGDVEVRKHINNLRDDDPEERHDAAKALENIGKRAAPAVPALAKCLRDEDEKVRYRAAKTLAKLGLESKGASGELGAALVNDASPKVRYYAAKALDEIADHEPEQVQDALPDLERALGDSDPRTRRYVLKTLAKLGAKAYGALGAIELLLHDSDASVRKTAESTIRRIEKKHMESSPE